MRRSSRWAVGWMTISIVACNKETQPPARQTGMASSVAQATSPPSQTQASNVRGRYIVPKASAARFVIGHSDASDFFDASEADVNVFEARLPGFLQSSSEPRAHGIAGKLDTYRRQFVGVMVGNSRMIFGNFFCSDRPLTEPVIVKDGGDCYFNLLFDPTSQAFSKLYINGEA